LAGRFLHPRGAGVLTGSAAWLGADIRSLGEIPVSSSVRASDDGPATTDTLLTIGCFSGVDGAGRRCDFGADASPFRDCAVGLFGELESRAVPADNEEAAPDA
jgi:hypothetical protein